MSTHTGWGTEMRQEPQGRNQPWRGIRTKMAFNVTSKVMCLWKVDMQARSSVQESLWKAQAWCRKL